MLLCCMRDLIDAALLANRDLSKDQARDDTDELYGFGNLGHVPGPGLVHRSHKLFWKKLKMTDSRRRAIWKNM